MTKENAINFLLFSYFGITIEEKDKLLSAAMDRAYIDAASHVLKFIFKDAPQIKKAERENYESMVRKAYKDKARGLLSEYFEEIARNKLTEDAFRTWHNELCTELKNIYKIGTDMVADDNPSLSEFYCQYYVENKFSFGIAQKWINMTIKYLFILNALAKNVSDGDTKLDAICTNLVDVVDIPVDDYILQAACDKNVSIPCRNNDDEYSGCKVDYKHKLPWSQWENEPVKYYEDFQKNLKKRKNKNETILEFENRLWIDTAKKRRESEKDVKN